MTHHLRARRGILRLATAGTAVSTGALIAPFVLLGSAYDGLLRKV